jgi:hypothetical protein
MNRIVSSLPGRLRLRDAGLRRSPQLGRLCAIVSGYQGVAGIEHNRHAGSMTVFYDVAQVTRGQIEARVEAAAARLLDTVAPNASDAAPAETAGRDDASAREESAAAAGAGAGALAAGPFAATAAQGAAAHNAGVGEAARGGARTAAARPSGPEPRSDADGARGGAARRDGRARQAAGGAEPAASWWRARPGGTLRVRVNRVARRGMLVSLAASMVLAALGRKRWHTVTGLVFLKFLAMHLWVHRRHLIR